MMLILNLTEVTKYQSVYQWTRVFYFHLFAEHYK